MIMQSKYMQISLEQAKALAEKSAAVNLARFISKSTPGLLENVVLEEEMCWMFFRKRSITIPAENSLSGDWAYVVSKRGEVRDVPDYFDNLEKAKEYLQKISHHFAINNG